MRALRPADAAALFATLSDPHWNGRTWIAEDADGQVVARVVAIPGHEDGVTEIGYITCQHMQRQGVARECSTALVAQLPAEGDRKITAEVDCENIGPVRLLKALGFTREAHFREHETTHIGLRDVAIYGLLASERG